MYILEGTPIVFTNESYIHSSHTQSKEWADGSLLGLKKPIPKGHRLIMVHAGGRERFIPHVLLIYPSGTKSGDYHNDMNEENFTTWVKTKLLSNLPPRSDYHNDMNEENFTTWVKTKLLSNLPPRSVLFVDIS
ncbi:hypothetical protein QE152_g27324 [Popillia japonica]|uniref:Uncharacterized protein n=1 Tax=Popillia japonica TaxID=7064 RepID=A0AAW1JWP1_POPJA